MLYPILVHYCVSMCYFARRQVLQTTGSVRVSSHGQVVIRKENEKCVLSHFAPNKPSITIVAKKLYRLSHVLIGERMHGTQ